jgi:hypothetical protein
MEISPVGELMHMGDVLVGDYAEKNITLSNVSPFEFSFKVQELGNMRGEANWLGGREFSFFPAEGVVAPGASLEITCRFAPDHPSKNYATTINFGQYRMRLLGRAHLNAAYILGGVECTANCVPEDVWENSVSMLSNDIIAAALDAKSKSSTAPPVPPPLNNFPPNPLAFIESDSSLFPALDRELHTEELLKVGETEFQRGTGIKTGKAYKGKHIVRESLFLDLKTGVATPRPIIKLVLLNIPRVELTGSPRTGHEKGDHKHTPATTSTPSVTASAVLVFGLCGMENKGECTFEVMLKKPAFNVEPASGKIAPGTQKEVLFTFCLEAHESSSLTDFVGQWIETKAQISLKGGYTPSGQAGQVFDVLIRVFVDDKSKL